MLVTYKKLCCAALTEFFKVTSNKFFIIARLKKSLLVIKTFNVKYFICMVVKADTKGHRYWPCMSVIFWFDVNIPCLLQYCWLNWSHVFIWWNRCLKFDSYTCEFKKIHAGWFSWSEWYVIVKSYVRSLRRNGSVFIYPICRYFVLTFFYG